MMSSNAAIRCELEYLHVGAQMCADVQSGHDGIKQIAPFMASIPYREDSVRNLESLIDTLEAKFPLLIEYGRKRAAKAYHSVSGTITKPSYSGRIAGTDGHGIDQIAAIEKIFSREPYSGGLSFTVFMPEDLIKRQRPGYVPCLLSGSYLLEDGELHLSLHFRSQSIVEFGAFDLMNSRIMQIDMVNKLNTSRPKSVSKISPGRLNVMCSRIFIHRRIVKIGNKQFIRRDELLPKWLGVVEQFRQTTE